MEKAYTDAQGAETAAPAAYAYDALRQRTAIYDSTGDTEYTYDGADNLAAITYPDGTRVSYEYDLNDNLIKVTDREGLATTYVYDAINRITEIHRPNSISTYYTYNEENLITELVNSCDDCGWVVSRYAYTYDERGFIISETAVESLAEYAWNGKLEKHDKNSAFAYRTVETGRTFTYDDAGKLLSVTETESGCGTCVYTYEYDLMGNRTAAVKTNAAGTVVENRKYVYNESNQLSEAVLCDGKTTRKVQYTYDADGNLTGEYSPTDRSLTTYTYTVENRLEAVYTGTAYSQTLQMAAAYDGDGNRVYQLNYNPDKDEDFSDYYCTKNSCDYKGTGIRLQVEGEVSPAERELLFLISASGAVTDSSYELIEYINDVNREYTKVLVEQNINGTPDTAYVYGAAIGIGSDRLSLDRFDSSTGYYLYDPKGSVTGIINEEGQIYQSYRYSVFGEITFGASEYENEYTYNGESYNPNIKSQYLRARYYCVVTADFLTEDSYLGNIREPLTLNRYNYCVGNPVNYTDPSGNNHVSFDPAAVNQLIYMLTGDEDYHEAADRMWEIQAEQRYYEKSVSLGVINGITESVYDACAVNLCSEIYTLFKNPDGNKKQSKRKKFHTYLDDKALKAADKNFYNLGKSCGDIIVYFAETYFSLYGLTELGGALTNDGGLVQVARLARANGGYDTLILVNDTALTEVIEGALGAVAGILSSQGTGSNLHENLGKIDMDGMLGSEGGSGSTELKEIYSSIKESPNYPEGFQPVTNGTTTNKINNQQLLEKLREIESGTWKKVYKDGYDAFGNKISIHYFQSESGKVFNVKVKKKWSN